MPFVGPVWEASERTPKPSTGVPMVRMIALPPPVPDDVPIVYETSNSQEYTPEQAGIDPATQWWCRAVRRPRFHDAAAFVFAPGNSRDPLLFLTLPATDEDETNAAGQYAVKVAQQLVRLLTDSNNQQAWESLRELLSSDGPMRRSSQVAWYRVHQWLPTARTASGPLDLPGLDL